MIQPRYNSNSGWVVWLGPGLHGRLFLRPPTLKASNFEALWTTDLIFLAWKDLLCFPKYVKIQKSCSIFRIGFALSKTLHLHRAYFVTIRKRKSMTVYLHFTIALTTHWQKSWYWAIQISKSLKVFFTKNIWLLYTVMKHQLHFS